MNGYVQDERYIAIEHMDEVRPGTGREGGLGYVRRDCVNIAQRSRRAACVNIAQRPRRSGYVQDERYTAGAGRAGAVPLSLAQCLTQGAGESGDRSKGHDLLFSADYADYADYTDYCMRVAWAKRRSGVYQVSKSKPHP